MCLASTETIRLIRDGWDVGVSGGDYMSSATLSADQKISEIRLGIFKKLPVFSVVVFLSFFLFFSFFFSLIFLSFIFLSSFFLFIYV